MKKFLFGDDYINSDIIGFDLDGTLYDEFEFIEQVYKEICNKLNFSIRDKVFRYMIYRWLEKGSSYPYIFSEAVDKFDLDDDFVEKGLYIFRNFNPQLVLSNKIKYILKKIKLDNKKLFLLTDGRELLQNKKIDSLNIRKYFDLIIIAQFYPKPDIYYSKVIKEHFKITNEKVVYIGDRERDKKFSLNSGFEFCHINDLI